MWYDDLEPDRPWSSLWYGYILCRCGGIRPPPRRLPRVRARFG